MAARRRRTEDICRAAVDSPTQDYPEIGTGSSVQWAGAASSATLATYCRIGRINPRLLGATGECRPSPARSAHYISWRAVHSLFVIVRIGRIGVLAPLGA